MKKVIMTREKICKSKEFVIDPETQKVCNLDHSELLELQAFEKEMQKLSKQKNFQKY